MAEATATIPGGVAMQPQPTSSSNPNLPAGTAGTALAPAGVAPAPAPLMSVEGFRSVVAQPNVRRVLPFVFLMLVAIALWLTQSSMNTNAMRTLLPGMSDADQQAALEALRNTDFKAKIDSSTGSLQVAADRYHEARMYLAGQGIPKGGTVGLDSLKDHSAMNTSQFLEQVKVNAAIEAEIARSVTKIATVRSARVHLATPRQSLFVRDRTPPKAAVVVTPEPGRVLSQSQVQAIVHLVSSSVPYLSTDNVTVVDHYGALLTQSSSEIQLGLTSAQAGHKQQLEELYKSRILQILTPIVGEANVRSQVNLTLDFTQIESSAEDYDSREKGPKTRSETLAEDKSVIKEASGVPGALANQPPESPQVVKKTEADPNEGKTEGKDKLSTRTTRNYELDKTVKHVKNAPGVIQRLTVAVVVNERRSAPPPSANGANPEKGVEQLGFSAAELEKMQELVRQVVGFEKARGDVVSVLPAKFEVPKEPDPIPWYLDKEIQGHIKNGLIGLLFLVFMLIVVRPIVNALVGKGKDDAAEQAKPVDGELTEEEMKMIQLGEGESLEQIKAKLKPKKSSISMDMLDTANTYDDKVALIRMLVAEDSGRVANVLKGMIKTSK
jgi:flagellar M-ring protein FliF